MKKSLVIFVGIIVAFIIIILLFVIFLQPKKVPITASTYSTTPFADSMATGNQNLSESPATFSTNFYKWYIANVEADPNFPSTDQLATLFPQWMTSDFILQYQSTIDDPNNDADPILFAQDDPRGWGQGITSTILTQTDTTSTIKVLIGSGSLTHTYTVQLTKASGQWLVSSISGTY